MKGQLQNLITTWNVVTCTWEIINEARISLELCILGLQPRAILVVN